MVGVWRWGCSGRYHRGQVKRATNVGRSWHEDVVPVRAEGTPLSDGGHGRVDEAGAADVVVGPSASGSAGATVSSGGALGGGAAGEAGAPPGGASDGPGGGGPSAGGFPADGLPADDAYGQSVTDPVGNGRADDLSADDSANDIPDRVLPADAPPNGGFPADSPTDDLPVVDPVDDLPAVADGEGMSPVVREYTERLRREALARDAELRARGIDPYKGTGVDEGPRRRLGARALVVLVVLVVAAVSVGAYVVFLRGEPDYGMSHGYQVQSDGSLKRPPVTDKAPEQPEEMSAGGEAGAKAAARYYLKARAYAWNTGDTGPLKSISEESCVHCQNAITHVEEFYAHGYWGTGGYNDVTETQIVRSLDENEFGPGAYAIQLRFDEHMPKGYTSNGYVDATVRDTIIKLHVHWDGTAWRVMEGAAENAEDVK